MYALAPKGGAPKGGAPKGGGPEDCGPEGWGDQHFALFCLSRQHFALFFLSGPKAAGASHDSPRACVKPRRLWGCRGFTRQPENSKREHFRAPAFEKHHQNSTKRHPRETQKERNGGGRGRKKSEILGGPAEEGPAEGGSRSGSPNRQQPEQPGVYPKSAPFFVWFLSVMDSSVWPFAMVGRAAGTSCSSARRRRERRLRMHWRHERLSVAMTLADALHHSAQPRAKPGEAEQYDAPRRQMTPPDREAEFYALSESSVVLGGCRPPLLRGPLRGTG